MKLKPCPFCGSEDVDIVKMYPDKWNVTFLRGGCEHCGGKGPNKMKHADAVRAWNRRAQ